MVCLDDLEFEPGGSKLEVLNGIENDVDSPPDSPQPART